MKVISTLRTVLVAQLLAAFVVSDTLYFTPTNVDQPSLYQTVQIQFKGWSSIAGDPSTKSGDYAFFVPQGTTTCPAVATGPTFVATAAGGGSTATITFAVSSAAFTSGLSYVACYFSTVSGLMYLTNRELNGNILLFTVLSPIYSAYSVTPSIVYAGQGVLAVTITESDLSSSGRPLNQGGVGSSRPFFLSCAPYCLDFATVASLCSNSSGTSFLSISGYGTTTLSGTFVAPQVPASGGYAVCVPYCYSTSAGLCSSASYSMSWVAVASSPLVIQGANPSVYTLSPTVSPTVRMNTVLNFSGTALTASDQIKIIASGASCSSQTAALMSNVNFNPTVTMLSSASTSVAVVSLELITVPITGQICYARGSNPTIFAPVFQSSSNRVSDFTVNPMQPQSFTLTPSAPSLGQTVSISFAGSNLNSATDSVYFVTSASPTCTVTSASNLCDGTSTAANYSCALTGSSSPLCSLTVDPPDSNSAVTLCVCYKTSISRNFMMVNGTASIAARNPLYSVSPYPFYAGQSATLQFVGSGFSTSDSVKFVSSSSSCLGAAVSSVTAANLVLSSSTLIQFTIVGPAPSCLGICYFFAQQQIYVISRPSTAISANVTCASTSLFIATFPMTYTTNPVLVNSKQTGTAVIATGSQTPTDIKFVAAPESCVITMCSGGAACALSPSGLDYFSAITGQTSVFSVASVSPYVLCVSLGSTFIPVVAAGTQSLYTFTVASRNPSSFSQSPAVWRVAMADISLTFSGTALNTSTDVIQVLANASLLSPVGACPLEGAVVSPLLTSSAVVSSSTTTAKYFLRGADELSAASTVHVCYYQGASGSRLATYVGSVTLAGRNPLSYIISGTVTTMRAGEPLRLLFPAGTGASLQPIQDSAFFFQYQSSSLTPSCRCDAVTCSTAVARVNSSSALDGSTIQSSLYQPNGFSNYASDAVYVICYMVAADSTATYLGQLPVGQAHPSYFNLGTSSNRVGLPIDVTVTTLCASCPLLSALDDLIMIANDTLCADATGLVGSTMEAITQVTVATSTSVTRRFVPLVAGSFRVCYKNTNHSLYQELRRTSSFLSDAVVVAAADPASFASVPASPTAGQYVILNLTSCSATTCATCSKLTVVAGSLSSCWNSALTSYASTSCVQSSRMYEFPNIFFPSGSYTLCFGVGTTVSRVPGVFVVGAANPSVFAAVTGTSIFTNQGSQAVISISGSGLTASDAIFLIPAVRYSCHDLRDAQIDILSDPVLSGWFTPDVTPNALTTTGSGTQWVASDSALRFSENILFSSALCDSVNVSCSFQLCYKRSGTSWAPVASATDAIKLFPPNPVSVIFDISSSPQVTQYVLATVTGTALKSSDYVYFSDGTCDGLQVVANTTSTPVTVSSDQKTWAGVVRFINTFSTKVFGCYVNGLTTTEILQIPDVSSILAPLLFTKNVSNGTLSHTYTQYEQAFVAPATSKGTLILNAVRMYLVDSALECNYVPYRPNAFPVAVQLSVVSGQTTFFTGRLVLSGTFALCANVSGFLFRITGQVNQSGQTAIVVLSPNPFSYTLSPPLPLSTQVFQIVFSFASGSLFEVSSARDTAVVISGSLSDCGFHNSSFEQYIPMTGGMQLVAQSTTNFTVCYRCANGSFATVPRFGLVDHNLQVSKLYPELFSASPSIAQSGVSFNLTFYNNGSGPFMSSDRPFLVLVTDPLRTGPASADCLQAATITATVVAVDLGTSLWRIAPVESATLTAGNYTVCYRLASNGSPTVVWSPGFLVIIPRQSPYGLSTDSVGGLAVFSGERIHLFLSSNVSLALALTFHANSTNDQVAFSSSPQCLSFLAITDVDSIPTSFAFASPSQSSAPFVHLVFRKSGSYYACVKRFGRKSNEQYFNFEAVGGPDSPISITVLDAPVTGSTVTPTAPRAWIPGVGVSPLFSTGFSATALQSLFVVPFPAVPTNSISDFACYLPSPVEASPAATLLVNSTLSIDKLTDVATFSFPSSGWYVLCYNSQGRTIASVTTPFFIANPSPIAYSVPAIISVGVTFTTQILSQDPIFAFNPNTAMLVSYSAGVLDCNAGSIAQGTNTISSFVGNSTVVSFDALVTANGTFYLCFLTYDQRSYFPVPNSAGGFTFGIGNVGPSKYIATPSRRYEGAAVTLTITGTSLRAVDLAKVVDVTTLVPSQSTFYSTCSAAALDANILRSSPSQGANVTYASPAMVTLTVRLTKGSFILCYKSVVNAWAWVTDAAYFSVDETHPVSWSYSPAPAFVKQTIIITITDTLSLLSASDAAKLVQRGSSLDGFDCTATGTAVAQLVNVSTTPSVRLFSACASSLLNATVCYKIGLGEWLEVPYRSAGVFAPLIVNPSPFSGPVLATSAVPRPFETFTASFTSTISSIALSNATIVSTLFAGCSATYTSVEPLFLTLPSGGLSFIASLRASGTYFLVLTSSISSTPFAHDQPLVIGPCDPCTFSPTLVFSDTQQTFKFPSSTIGSLGAGDVVRIVPTSVGISSPSFCSDSTGFFGSRTFSANTSSNGTQPWNETQFVGNGTQFFGNGTQPWNETQFFVAIADSRAAGSYYVCYKKGAATDYAIVSANGVPVTLQIVNPIPSVVSSCPQSLNSGSGVTLTVARPPNVSLVILSTADSAAIRVGSCSDATQPAAFGLSLVSVNDSTAVYDFLPQISGTFAFCYRHALDGLWRLVQTIQIQPSNPSNLLLQPVEFTVGITSLNISVIGQQLSLGDVAYVVSNATLCQEYCRSPLSPQTVNSFAVTQVTSTTMSLRSTEAFTATTTIAVCYRRTGSTLSRVAEITVGPPNPSSWNSSFVPRLGTRPLIAFAGKFLTAADNAKLVPASGNCSSAPVVSGNYNSSTLSQATSYFFFPLVAPVALGTYIVCYNVANTGWVAVPPTMSVQAGGPTSYSTSNTVMAGRATTISFPSQDFVAGPFGIGDEILVACSNCSCWDEIPASVPYGNSTLKVNSVSAKSTMRLGFGTPVGAAMPLCYKIADSGFAQVGASIVVAASSPSSKVFAPAPSFQGQRLTITFQGNTTRLTALDTFTLVDSSRGCWELPTVSVSGVLWPDTNLTFPSRVHFPSLGPNASLLTFPRDLTACVKEAGQPEYLHVRFPTTSTIVQAPSPSAFASTPAVITSQMINVSVDFPGTSSPGDTAFAVVGTVWSDAICDDPLSVTVASIRSAHPFVFSVSPIGGSVVTLCFIREGATVAEVPQQLLVGPQNPSSFSLNTSVVRSREYVRITLFGHDLTEALTMSVVTKPCQTSAGSGVDSIVARQGDPNVSSDSKQYSSVVQLMSGSNQTAYLCAFVGGAWTQVGTFDVLESLPATIIVSPQVARIGQHVKLTWSPITLNDVVQASVIQVAGSESWCHNFTLNRESRIAVFDANHTIESSVWTAGGNCRVCTLRNNGTYWSDVSRELTTPSSIFIDAASPSSIFTFPSVPRVGQRVTAFLTVLAAPSALDTLVFADGNSTALCDSFDVNSSGLSFHPTIINSTVVSVTVEDGSDRFRYRSFNNSGTLRTCYYSFVENSWNVVGGSYATSLISISNQSPVSWVVTGGKLVANKAVAIAFVDPTGILNATSDVAWAVPSNESCFVRNCTYCIELPFDVVMSNRTTTFTKAFITPFNGVYNLCYTLGGATASMLPTPMVIELAEIQCSYNATVSIGQRQNVTFRVTPNVSTSDDILQFSFFGTTATDCQSNTAPDFPAARALIVSNTSTAVTFSLEWPVTLAEAKYAICYLHKGEYYRLCTCAQTDARVSDCYLQTTPAVPSGFDVSPTPAYVGQSLALRVLIPPNASFTQLVDVKLVPWTFTNLTTCLDAALPFVSLSQSIVTVNATAYDFRFKHNFAVGRGTFAVCALLQGSRDYARLPLLGAKRTLTQNLQLLEIRPFFHLTTSPSDQQYLRASMALQLVFTHTSTEADDTTNLLDSVMFVTDPYSCNESSLSNATFVASSQGWFQPLDSDFAQIPATVSQVTAKSSSTIVTFHSTAVGIPLFVCYKPFAATWAVVNETLVLAPAAFLGCEMNDSRSDTNNDSGYITALQYIFTTLRPGNATSFSLMQSAIDDIKLVAATTTCYGQSQLASPKVTIDNQTLLPSTILFSIVAGDVKVCYRFGGTTNRSLFSPVCSVKLQKARLSLNVTSGCFAEGQTLDGAIAVASAKFAPSDTVCIVAGDVDCVLSRNALPPCLGSLAINGSTQSSAGWALPEYVSNLSSALLLPVTISNGTTTMKFCYRNSNNSYFVVPWFGSTISVSVQQRQPVAAALFPPRPQVSQFVTVTFSGANDSAVALAGDALLPITDMHPYTGFPAVDGGGAARSNSGAGEGVCYRSHPPLTQVSSLPSNRTAVGMIFGTSGNFTNCYKSHTLCSLVDVPQLFRVYEANPAAARVFPLTPRRGQLLNFSFLRVTNESDATLLATSDKAHNVADVSSCWNLTLQDGANVVGNTTVTRLDTIYPADAPGQRAVTTTLKSCYLLTEASAPTLAMSWSQVPASTVAVAPANPVMFSSALTPMTFQLVVITFVGSNFTSGDKAKVIAKSLNCSDYSEPPAEIVSYSASLSPIHGSSGGWGVVAGDSGTSYLNVSFNSTGTFSVCYKLASDAVWTLVYGDLLVHQRNPASVLLQPVSALEGELFTMVFAKSNDTYDSQLEMAIYDQVELHQGESNCLLSTATDVIATSPSRTDLLPNTNYFQLAAGTRGVHTLCYVRYFAGNRFPSWGFPPIVIGPNPASLATEPETPRAMQIVRLIFNGFGLSSHEGVADEVKLISASLWTQDDVSCRLGNQSSSILNFGFSAHGNYSTQSFVALTPQRLWVCYRLSGGQYHVMLDGPLVIVAASPIVRSADLQRPVFDNMLFNMALQFAGTGLRQNDTVYLSARNCTETPGELAAVASSFVTQNSTSNEMTASLRPTAAGHFALCFRSPLDPAEGSTSILAFDFNVAPGQPLIHREISIAANQVASFTLQWNITDHTKGFVSVVSNKGACVGPSHPASEAIVQQQRWDNQSLALTLIVPAMGTYYVCSLDTSLSYCEGADCARIVAMLTVSSPTPALWTSASGGYFVSSLIQLYFSPAPQGPFAGWISPVTTVDATSVAQACMDGPVLSLLGPIRVNVSGGYAVCFVKDGVVTVFPSLPLIVFPSVVVSLSVQDNASAGSPVAATVRGHGLTYLDSLLAVLISTQQLNAPLSDAVMLQYCNSNDSQRVFATTSQVLFGETAVSWSFAFSSRGVYGLCYSFWGNGTRQSLGKVLSVFPFVTQLVVSPMTPVSSIAFFITMIGVSLTTDDSVGIVSSDAVCDESLSWTRVSSGSAGNTSSTATLVVPVAGVFAVCLKSPLGSLQRLQQTVVVIEKRVEGIQFTTLPRCVELSTCVTQPRISLLDATGRPTFAQDGASISLTLLNAAGIESSGLMRGQEAFSFTGNSAFQFYSFLVVCAGTFRLQATVTTNGGATLQTLSPAFEVNVNSTLQTLALSCSPLVLVFLSESDQLTMSCVVKALIQETSSSIVASSSVGRVIGVAVPSDNVSLPQFGFNVQVPFLNYSVSNVFVQARSNDSIFVGRLVSGSPTTALVGYAPDNSSALECTPSFVVDSVRYVRQGEAVGCTVHATVAGTYSVNTRADFFVVQSRQGPAVLTPPFASTFAFVVPTAAIVGVLNVTSQIQSSLGHIVGSPMIMTVLVPPTQNSLLSCISVASGSSTFFLPGESIMCTIAFRDDAGTAVSVLSSDVQLTSTSAKISNPSGRALVSSVDVFGFAANLSTALLRSFESFGSLQDVMFSVTAQYVPTTKIVATTVGTLVAVTTVKGANASLNVGDTMTLQLSGSGLSLLHSYFVSPRSSCNNSLSEEVIPPVVPRASTTAGDLLLSFVVPRFSFYVCFTPNGTTALQLLFEHHFLNITAVSSDAAVGSLTYGEVVLLIVGLSLLVLLLLLLPLVVWRAFRRRQAIGIWDFVARRNDRFIHQPRTDLDYVADPPPDLPAASPTFIGVATAPAVADDNDPTEADPQKKKADKRAEKRQKSERKAAKKYAKQDDDSEKSSVGTPLEGPCQPPVSAATTQKQHVREHEIVNGPYQHLHTVPATIRVAGFTSVPYEKE